MNGDSSNVLILIQAPADIPYALHYIDHHKNDNVDVVVINVENVYKFMQTIDITINSLLYIPYPSVKVRPLKCLRETRQKFLEIWNKYFKAKAPTTDIIYFFSRYEDSLTFSIIDKFYKANHQLSIFYVNHYDPILNVNKNPIVMLKCIKALILYRYICEVWFRFSDVLKFPEFKVKNYKRIKEIKAEFSSCNLDKYKVKYPRERNLLFLTNPLENCIGDKDEYFKVVKDICAYAKGKGYTLYFKGHPRMGLDDKQKSLSDCLVESFIPSEFLDLSSFKIIIGCESVSIAHAASSKGNGVISIIKLLSHVKDLGLYVKYLTGQSNEKLLMPESIDELYKYI